MSIIRYSYPNTRGFVPALGFNGRASWAGLDQEIGRFFAAVAPSSAQLPVDFDEDKDNAAYIDSLGWILFRRGHLEDARKELERAITLGDGDDPTIYDHLGDVYLRLRQVERARTAWRQALTLYERDGVRTMDKRYKDLQRKYKLLDSARQP